MSSSVCGLPNAAVKRRSSSPLAASSAGDAFEHAVADERARELLRQRAGERPVDDAGDLGCRQNLVHRLFEWSSPGTRGRPCGEECGAPGRVGQPGAMLVVLWRHREQYRAPRPHSPPRAAWPDTPHAVESTGTRRGIIRRDDDARRRWLILLHDDVMTRFSGSVVASLRPSVGRESVLVGRSRADGWKYSASASTRM